MNPSESVSQAAEYRCPGERLSISRAVHLGRLAAFYPACRECEHRHDTGTLSPRQVEQLADVHDRSAPPSIFHDEGAGGVFLNDFTLADARRCAAAFGDFLHATNSDSREPRISENLGEVDRPKANPSVVLAGDGRPLTAEIVAAASEELRFAGCDVIDIGPATAPCVAMAVERQAAGGGILVGNPGNAPHAVGLKFWIGGCPLSASGTLEPLARRVATGGNRPQRRYGGLRRFAAEKAYCEAVGRHYHAIRPLRLVVDSASRPLVDCLRRLTANFACEIVPIREARQDMPRQIRDDKAHLGVCVDGDGETCRALDEHGREVAAERLLLLLAGHVAPKDGPGLSFSSETAAAAAAPDQWPLATVVLERGLAGGLAEKIVRHGRRVVESNAQREDMAAVMRKENALFGGGPSGRFWFGAPGFPAADALLTITALVVLLSRSDSPFSKVLDREAMLD